MKIYPFDFFSWYRASKADYRHYIGISSIRVLFRPAQHEEKEFTKIMRILLHDFIQNDALACFLTSRKTKRGEMTQNLECLRNIEAEILRPFSAGPLQ
jgi:hypothetical protein